MTLTQKCKTEWTAQAEAAWVRFSKSLAARGKTDANTTYWEAVYNRTANGLRRLEQRAAR